MIFRKHKANNQYLGNFCGNVRGEVSMCDTLLTAEEGLFDSTLPTIKRGDDAAPTQYNHATQYH